MSALTETGLAAIRESAGRMSGPTGRTLIMLVDEVTRLREALAMQTASCEALEVERTAAVREAEKLRTATSPVAAAVAVPRVTAQPLVVLRGMASGEFPEETARRLVLSIHTVKSHKRSLYKQLGARTGPHAVALGMAAGLITAEDIRQGVQP